MELFAKHAVSLSSGKLAQDTVVLDLDPQTDWIEVEIPRTGAGVTWDAGTTLGVSIIVARDGESFMAQGRSTVGNRAVEPETYRLRYTLPSGYMGGATAARLGERKQATFTAKIALALLAGAALTTTLLVTTEASALDLPERHNSVAYDAQSSGLEQAGDGVLVVSHTSTGSDRAALVAVSTRGQSIAGTLAWDGGGATIGSALWSLSDIPSTAIVMAGYPVTGQATGAQNVTSDLTATSTTDHFVGIISMTGVDQATPTGDVDTVAPAFDAQPSLTLTGMTADDLLVDHIESQNAPTAGANQTQRVTQNSSFPTYNRMSTQAGADGGVMSWTYAGDTSRAYAAVVFKASSGAAATWGPLVAGQNNRLVQG